MLVSLYYVISCDIINIKSFLEMLTYFFQIPAVPLMFAIVFLKY